MKKLIIFSAIIISVLSVLKYEEVIIPKEAIRFRVIASSNNYNDQRIKKELVKELEQDIIKNDLKDINSARNYFKNTNKFTNIVDKKLKEENYSRNFNINYGKNYFPKKVYKNVVYEEGEYESLVITLGDGLGENFWCVLFPPLCLIDEEEKEYPSLIKTIIDKYF